MKFIFQVGKVTARMMVNMCDKHKKCQESNPLEGKYVTTSKSVTMLLNSFSTLPILRGNQGPQLHTRIVTSPAYAKALLETLRESIVRYERTFSSDVMNPDPENN